MTHRPSNRLVAVSKPHDAASFVLQRFLSPSPLSPLLLRFAQLSLQTQRCSGDCAHSDVTDQPGTGRSQLKQVPYLSSSHFHSGSNRNYPAMSRIRLLALNGVFPTD
jgi:hypothetical protein